MYDLKTVETLSGEVMAVEKFSPGRGGPPQGLRLRVKFPQETLLVILGPIVYVEQQNVKFAAGDRVEVKGSRMTVRGEPLIVAAEVKKGDQVLKMRNATRGKLSGWHSESDKEGTARSPAIIRWLSWFGRRGWISA